MGSAFSRQSLAKSGETVLTVVENQAHCAKVAQLLKTKGVTVAHHQEVIRQIERVTLSRGAGVYSILYGAFQNMVGRCYNPDKDGYRNYGGRGIGVVDHWLRPDGVNFIDWAVADWQKGLQLDRIDVNAWYGPENCRWVTASQNERNKRTTIRLPDGRVAADVADLHGVPLQLWHWRRRQGWNLLEAVTYPPPQGWRSNPSQAEKGPVRPPPGWATERAKHSETMSSEGDTWIT